MARIPPKLPRQLVKGEYPVPAAQLATEFHLGQEESFLWDLWAQEHVSIAGTDMEYYALNVPGTKMDPVYDEPVERKFEGPYKIKAYVEFPNDDTDSDEKGMRKVWTGSVWIPRVEIEKANDTLVPGEGDIIRIWNIPFYNQNWNNMGEDVPGGGYYFELTNVADYGHVFDTPWFTGYYSPIRRRSDYTPERRLRDQ